MSKRTVTLTFDPEEYDDLVAQAQQRSMANVEAYLLALIEIDGEALADEEGGDE